MTENKKNTSKSKKHTQKIMMQDFCNTYMCLKEDSDLKNIIDEKVNDMMSTINNYKPEKIAHVWTDGSFNFDKKKAGIGIAIVTDETKDFDGKYNICYGKSVNAKSALVAEIYALSIGISYVLDTFPDIQDIMVHYDCVNATICAANIEAYVSAGAPYTNLKSALKRIKKKNINVIFSHTKAHSTDENNALCDLIARKYANINLTKIQEKYLRKQMHSV